MRIRIHADVAKLVNERRKNNKRSANAEVNMALAMHYMTPPVFDTKAMTALFCKNLGAPKRVMKK